MADLWLHDYQIAVLQHQNLVTQLALHQIQARRRRRRRRPQVPRAIWVRPWISRRRQFGMYDQLLVELRREDQEAFKNILRMPTEMYDELVPVSPNKEPGHPGAPGSWVEYCHHSAPHRLWDQVCAHEV